MREIHHLDLFKIWSSGGATCIGYKFGHHVASLALSNCLGVEVELLSRVVSECEIDCDIL